MRALLVVLLLLWSMPVHADSVTIFAAASTRDALGEVAAAWQAATGHTLVISVAGSSVLARQIARGAPADVYLSASPDWMDWLDDHGHIRADTRSDLVGNGLVLIVPGPNTAPMALGDLATSTGRIATALLDAVPAGIYAKQALTSLALWDDLAPRLIQADNVRAALMFVARGEAPFGIVYASDAVASDQVSVAATFPSDGHAPIVYPVATTVNADMALSTEFIAFLTGPAGRAAFERQGFTWLAP